MPKLEIIYLRGRKRGASEQFKLNHDEVALIGSARGSHLNLTGEPGVQTLHASLVAETRASEATLIIVPKHGARTFVNKIEISAPVAVSERDQISFGYEEGATIVAKVCAQEVSVAAFDLEDRQSSTSIGKALLDFSQTLLSLTRLDAFKAITLALALLVMLALFFAPHITSVFKRASGALAPISPIQRLVETNIKHQLEEARKTQLLTEQARRDEAEQLLKKQIDLIVHGDPDNSATKGEEKPLAKEAEAESPLEEEE